MAFSYVLQLSNRSKGDTVNAPFTVESDSLHQLEKYVMTTYLKRDGDTCIIRTPTDRLIIIEKDTTNKSRFNSGYKFNTNI